MAGPTILILVGVVLLLGGGTALVRGASNLATKHGISPLIVGLTIVAFGTSAPELVVTVLGSIQGLGNLAFGNVVGSNVANLGLVLGTAALLAPVAIQGQVIRREVPLLLLATAVLLVLSLDDALRGLAPVLDRADALVLFLLFSIFSYVTIGDIASQRADPLLTGVAKLPLPHDGLETRREVMYLVAGTVALTAGAQLVLVNGTALADYLGVPAVVIGLFIVAVGTSLPELVTSVIAAVRQEPDLCVGNVVGSNLMNSLFILPLGALLNPIRLPEAGVLDILVSLGFTLALIPVFIAGRRRLGRAVGSVFLLAYLGYVLARAIGS